MLKEEVIEKYLFENGFDVSVKGFCYLTRAIQIYDWRRKMVEGVYMKVAEEYETNWRSVERCMRREIQRTQEEKISTGKFIAKANYILTRDNIYF